MEGIWTDSKVLDAFFSLLRAGLWNTVPDRTSIFPLSSEQWEAIYKTAVNQTVVAIVYDGIMNLPEALFPPESQLLKWVVSTDRIESASKNADSVVLELTELFTDAGLHPIVLKGQGVAQLYDRPNHRECGDIDLYFPTVVERQRAETLLKVKGVDFTHNPDNSISYSWRGIQIEQHDHILDIVSPFRKAEAKKIVEECGFDSVSLGDGKSFNAPSKILNLILLNLHAMKHAFGLGIGLRQICDIAMAYRDSYEVSSPRMLEDLYKRSCIWRWAQIVHPMLIDRIGLPAEMLPFEAPFRKYDDLFAIIMEGGNFGQHSSNFEGRLYTGSGAVWRRKMATMGAFLKRMSFSMRLAPGEACWNVIDLVLGQVRKKLK